MAGPGRKIVDKGDSLIYSEWQSVGINPEKRLSIEGTRVL
jgi:hypothetical protein